MSDESSGKLVVRWRGGDQQAAGELFHRYASRLIALARSRLSNQMAQRIDPEDVVQSAYRCFFADSRAGRYEFQQSGDLWKLLVAITLHKLQCQVQHFSAGKRSVRREQHFGSEDSLLGLQGPDGGREPSAIEAVALSDELESLLRKLEPDHRRMVEMRLQEHTLEEIAAEVRCSERTVRRVLEHVKQLLQAETGADGAE